MGTNVPDLEADAGVELLRVPGWAAYPWLRHGFAWRAGGVSTVYGGRTLNLGMTKEDDAAAVAENRRRVVAAAGGGVLVTARQVHSDVVQVVPAAGELRTQVLEARPGVPAAGELRTQVSEARPGVPGALLAAATQRVGIGPGDGLVTARAGVLLGVLAADCVPVLLVDVRLRVVGAVHAGWRGTAAGIAARGVEAMAREFGTRGEDVVAAVGPSIGPCCYEVGEEVRAAFGGDLFGDLFGHGRLDLWEANRRELVGAGVRAERITVMGECTACAREGKERRYFSHRGEGGVAGRGMGVVGVV